MPVNVVTDKMDRIIERHKLSKLSQEFVTQLLWCLYDCTCQYSLNCVIKRFNFSVCENYLNLLDFKILFNAVSIHLIYTQISYFYTFHPFCVCSLLSVMILPLPEEYLFSSGQLKPASSKSQFFNLQEFCELVVRHPHQ